MTAIGTGLARAPLTVAPEEPVVPARPDRALLDALGYVAHLDVLIPPPDGPVFRLRVCRVTACEATGPMSGRYQGMCRSCWEWFDRSGVSVEEFADRPRGTTRIEYQNRLCAICRTPGHQRAVDAYGLCQEHLADFRSRLGDHCLTLAAYPALGDVGPLPTVGECGVADCAAPVAGPAQQLCRGHRRSWARHCSDRGADGADVAALRRWAALAFRPPSRWLDLAGLPPTFLDELLTGLVATAELGGHISFTEVRCLVYVAVRHQVAHLSAWAAVGARATTGYRAAELLSVAHRRAASSPERERALDVWDLRIWGMPKGLVRFGAISQSWLKDLAKAFAFADVPTRARTGIGASTTRYVGGVAALSTSLARRPDRGEVPEALSRVDIERFLDDALANENAGLWSADSRQQALARARFVLTWAAETGYFEPASCGFDMDPTFTIRSADVPHSARCKRGRPEEEPGRAYTTSQMAVFVEQLSLVEDLASAKARVAMELVIVTGRRPIEICHLRADCLRLDVTEREDGEQVSHPQLHYYASKIRRWHSVYIDEATAELVRGLITDARRAFPGVSDSELRLFPRRTNPRNGREPANSGWLTRVFAQWRAVPVVAAALQGRDGDARLYDFRHSFAQRHADAGVPIDVLQQLMGHGTSDSTRHYYEVSRDRRRQAVGVMRRFRFDRNGVLVDAGQRELLDNEYQRAGLAGVAVPLGECSHPSMLRPGDQRCPVRYRCMGCPAFSTSVDRLPELRRYLDELLRSRESILASDLAEWAKQDALPMQGEIDQVERLVARAEELLAQLPPGQRVEVDDAVTVYRTMRDEVRSRAATPVVLRVRIDGAPVNLGSGGGQ
ncbi:MAG: hypothetical protein QOH36_1857 [Actinomycetota bacterium]|nr:hypothetical protein [Actinomycetota bacterium]